MSRKLSITLLFLSLFSVFQVKSQEVTLFLQGNKLVNFNPTTCEYTLLSNFSQSFTDIAIHPNGKLYGVRSQGQIYEMNPNTGQSTQVYQVSRSPNIRYTALAASVNNKLYIGEQDGDLVTYDPTINEENYLGNIGFVIEGDLSFRNGVLYAGSTDSIIEINQEDVSLSQELSWFTSEKPIWGINTAYISCDEQLTYALTGQSRPSIFYSINMDTQTSTEVCQINEVVYGSTSEDELLASATVDAEIEIIQPSCENPGLGTVNVIVKNGVDASFSLNGSNPVTTPVFDNLPTGDYNLKVIDTNGCETEFDFFIEDYPPIGFNFEITHATCTKGGSINIIPLDGQQLSLSLDGGQPTAPGLFEDLMPGDHTIIFTNHKGCEAPFPFTIEGAELDFDVSLTTQPKNCIAGGILNISVIEGENLSYRVDDGTTTQNETITNIEEGSHILYVTDENGCVGQYNFSIEEDCIPSSIIKVPSAFSPDSNGTNDIFKVLAPEEISLQVLTYKIFNRWGNLLYEVSNFDHTQESQYWQGVYENGELFDGAFLYYITYQLTGSEETGVLSGISYVIR